MILEIYGQFTPNTWLRYLQAKRFDGNLRDWSFNLVHRNMCSDHLARSFLYDGKFNFNPTAYKIFMFSTKAIHQLCLIIYQYYLWIQNMFWNYYLIYFLNIFKIYKRVDTFTNERASVISTLVLVPCLIYEISIIMRLRLYWKIFYVTIFER